MDGLVERCNRTLIDMLPKTAELNGKNWDEKLPFVLFAYVTGFAKRGLLYIHASDFATLMSHYIKLFTHNSLMIEKSSHKISKLYLNYKLSYI